MILMSVTVMIVGELPSPTDRTFQSDYNNILMLAPRIFIASIIAYFAGEFTNSFILAKMKIKSAGKHLRQRTIGSTLIGQIIDTGLFVLIAFYGILDNDLLRTIIISNYILKVSIEILFTPITYAIT